MLWNPAGATTFWKPTCRNALTLGACLIRVATRLLRFLALLGGTFHEPLDATPMTGGTLVFLLLIGLAVYVYTALAVQTIAEKTKTENPWLAWIPIANIILLLNIAKKPIWWIVLFLIPLVNIIFIIMVWMGVAEARGKPNWVGILMIVPLVGAIVPGYLAWAD
jgi:hypothetical protein